MNANRDMVRLASALGYLDPTDRDLWVQMAMCIKSALGEAGFEVWNDWGSRADNHCPSAARAVWKSVRENGRMTAASLIFKARLAGWQDPSRRLPSAPCHPVWNRRAQGTARFAHADNAGHSDGRSENIDAARTREAALAAQAAQRIWASATDCSDHPYLERKGVSSHGLRQGSWEVTNSQTGEVYATTHSGLLIPLRDHQGQIWTLQCIHPSPSRSKLFLKGGAKRGHFFQIGQSVEAVGDLVIALVLAEGYATGASIHAATGLPVWVCFDTSNLLPVAQALRGRYPKARMLFGADNDIGVAGNPGVTKAMHAALAVDGDVVVPPPGDFNDLHMAEGLQAVRRHFEAHLGISLPPEGDRSRETGEHRIGGFTASQPPSCAESRPPTAKTPEWKKPAGGSAA